MADYGFIARGVQPIDIASPLLQVEQIRQARAQEQRQNELLALRRQEMDDARKKAEVQTAQTETQARLRAEIPAMEAAFAAGRGAEWMATKPELAGFADQAGNPQFVDMMRNYAYQAAGLEMPARAPGPIEMRDMGDGYRVLMQDGKALSNGVIRPESSSSQKPPAGYQWAPGGSLAAIPGGPADQPKPSPAVKAVDTKYSSDYLQWVQVGEPDAKKSIEELQSVVTQLQQGKELTGGVTGYLPKIARDFVNPEAGDAQDLVEQTVQRSLRAVLGAQFTQAEGDRLISRAYNTRLSPETNAIRVGRLLDSLKQAYNNKEAARRYYEANGTLEGFSGKSSYTLGDFERSLTTPSQGQSNPTQGSQPASPRTIKLPSGATVTINED